jgi:hypothetical protein
MEVSIHIYHIVRVRRAMWLFIDWAISPSDAVLSNGMWGFTAIM